MSTEKFITAKKSRLRMSIVFDMALKNMRFKKLRSGLTILGVVIGIGAIFFLISLGFGLRNLVTKEIVGSQSVKTIDVASANSKIIILNKQNIQQFKEMSGVEDVGTAYSFAGSASFDGAETDTVVFGVDKQYLDLSSLSLITGEVLNVDEKGQMVVSKALLEKMGLKDPNTAVGKELSLLVSAASSNSRLKEDYKANFKIIGVYESEGGSEIFLSGKVFDDLQVEMYSQTKVVAENTEVIPNIRQQIESKGFQTQSPIDTLNEINRIFKFFNIILVGFGSVGMIVAVLGMFNTLTISLLERTQEVGLMMSIGSRRRDIRMLFTIEAWLLAFLGGLSGIIGAAILSTILNIVVNASARGRGVSESFSLFSMPFYTILLTLVFTTLVGLAVVYFPAKRAAEISPIDALRNE
ncbi:ABC transporter permease [Candidatus Saccharibacteria bacterium CPR2]|nr:ABC transporter permease [Candidatus Saccharibacteria bacterium CPR2]